MPADLQYGKEGNRPYSLYYKHSGHTPIPSLLLAFALGIVAAIVIATAYVYFLKWANLTSVLLPAVLGAAIGYSVGWIARITKMRSYSVVLAVVGITTLAGYYACWVIWIKLAYDDAAIKDPQYRVALFDLIRQPDLLVRLIKGMNPPGASRYVFWIGEAALVFLFAFLASRLLLRGQMFCETCKRWCGKPLILRRVAVGDKARLRQSLEAHDFSYLQSLTRITEGRHWEVSYDHCASCNQLHALSVKQGTAQQQKMLSNRNKKIIVDRLLLEPEEAQAIKHSTSHPAQPPGRSSASSPRP